MLPYGNYYTFEASSYVNVNTTITFSYNDTVATAAGIAQKSLRFAYFNETANKWEFLNNTIVNTTGKIVQQTSPLYSVWGLFGINASLTNWGEEVQCLQNQQKVIISFKSI